MEVFKLDDSGCAVLPATSSTASSPETKLSSESLSFDSGSEFFYESSIKKEYLDDPKQACFYEPMPADAVYSTKEYSLPPYPGSEALMCRNGKGDPVTILCENKAELPESSSSPPAHKGKPGRRANHGQEQNSFAAADSNSGNTPSKSFVPCKVCGDKASGYHYGVTSCEGCKGFFRRSIQKQIEYRCLRDGKCLVIRLNRNRCQYCRFKKCLAVGMSRDSVRYGRVPKRSRERGEENRVTQSEPDQSVREVENKQLAMHDIILTISQAHHANCAYTEEKTRGIVRKPAIFSLDNFQTSQTDGSPSSVNADSLEQQKIVMWQHFAALITPSIQRVVEFAKRIPGFLDLTQDDQLILIKLGFFEIWLVHISRMINALDNTLTFSDGSYITRQQMELMFDHDFVAGIFNFMIMFNNLQLNDTEVGIFASAILLQSERTGIYDTKSIDRQQEKLMEALKLQIGRNHPSDTHIFPNLLMNVPELRGLGAKHGEHLQWFRANWTRLKLPPLFAEIFDIPKSEEEFIH